MIEQFKTFFNAQGHAAIGEDVINLLRAGIAQLTNEEREEALFYVLKGEVEDEDLQEKAASVACVYLLMEAGVSPNITTQVGVSPLNYACSFGYTECASLLIASRASTIEISPHGGQSLLDAAVSNDHFDCLQLLLENGATQVINHRDGDTGYTALDVAVSDECYDLLLNHGGVLSEDLDLNVAGDGSDAGDMN